MNHKKLKRGLKYKFKKIIRKLKRIFVLFMIAFVIYNVVSYINTGAIKTKTAQDNEIVIQTQKVVKTAENDEINVDIIKTNVKDIPVCSKGTLCCSGINSASLFAILIELSNKLCSLFPRL